MPGKVTFHGIARAPYPFMTMNTKAEGKRTPGRGAQDAKVRAWELAATIDVTRDMIRANVVARACKGCEDSAIALLLMWE